MRRALAGALFLTLMVVRAEPASVTTQTTDFTDSGSRPNRRDRVAASLLRTPLLQGANAQGHVVETDAKPTERQVFSGSLSSGGKRESGLMLLLGAALLLLGGLVRRRLSRKDSSTQEASEPASVSKTPQSPALPESLVNPRHSPLVRTAPVRIVRAAPLPQADGSKERVDAPTKALRDPRLQRSPDRRRARALDT
jgi:hypothetical protein